MFNKNRSIFYLNRKNIVVILENNTLGLKLDFGEDEIHNLEVTDKNRLELELKDFINKNNLQPHDVYIVLAEDIMFVKTDVLINPKDLEKREKAFFDEVPLDPEELSEKVVTDINAVTNATYFAVNKHMYEFIVEALRQIKWPVKAIVPDQIFSKYTKFSTKNFIENMPFANMFEVLNDPEHIKLFNFTLPEAPENPDSLLNKMGMQGVAKTLSKDITKDEDDLIPGEKAIPFWKNKRNIGLVVVLALLAIILVVVLIRPDLIRQE